MTCSMISESKIIKQSGWEEKKLVFTKECYANEGKILASQKKLLRK